MKNTSPITIIEKAFVERRGKNSNYSLNAFARDLGTSTAQLSRILNGKRNLTHRQAAKFSGALNLTQAESNIFIQMVIQHAPQNAKVSKQLRISADAKGIPLKVTSYPIDRMKLASSWYHMAILSLVYVDDFEPLPKWVATRLGIDAIEAKDAIQRLLDLKLLEVCPLRGLKVTSEAISIKAKHSDPGMRKLQSDYIEKAQKELQKTSDHDFARRLINGITFPCDSKFIPELKEMIHEFQFKILALIKNQKHQEVYRLNCQLFPLSKPKGEKK
jgi:uncharacterized protein (TIGR02147 family)